MDKRLVAALRQLVGGIEDRDFPYYHVSDHPERPTIHTEAKREYYDPEGIYLFIKGEGVAVDEWADKKYRWDAKLKSEKDYIDILKFGHSFTNVLNLLDHSAKDIWGFIEKDAETNEDYHEIHGELQDEENPASELHQYFIQNPWRFFEFLRGYFKNRKKFTAFLRDDLDFKGIIDHEGCCVYGGEPQVIVFNPGDIQFGPREENIPDPDVYIL